MKITIEIPDGVNCVGCNLLHYDEDAGYNYCHYFGTIIESAPNGDNKKCKECLAYNVDL